jgi:hypothetical protein
VGGGKASPARARPAKAKKPARKAAPAAQRAKVARSRPASRREAAPKKQPVGLYLGIGGVVVVFVAVILILVMSAPDQPPPPPPDVADSGAEEEVVGIQPRDRTPVAPESSQDESGTEPGSGTTDGPEDDPGGGAPGMGTTEGPDGAEKPDRLKPEDRSIDTKETDPYKMTRGALLPKNYEDFVPHLKHLDSTPTDLRNEIDKHCKTLVDFQAGSDVNVAQDRLVEIGKPAVPRILAMFAKAGDLSSMEGVSNAFKVDETLRKICGTHSKTDAITPFSRPSKKEILRTAKYWCIWWFTRGHTMDKYIEDEADEEEDE